MKEVAIHRHEKITVLQTVEVTVHLQVLMGLQILIHLQEAVVLQAHLIHHQVQAEEEDNY